MKDILAAHMNSGSLISVYTNRFEWDSFSFGRVVYLSGDIFVLESYTKFGDRSGYEIRKLESVSKVESGGFYETYLAALIEAEGPVHHGLALNMSALGSECSGALRVAKANRAIVSIWGDDDDQPLVGTVSSFDENIVEISVLDRYGRRDGLASIKSAEVTAVDYETRELQLRRKFAMLSVP